MPTPSAKACLERRALHCRSPDTGNMDLLHLISTEERVVFGEPLAEQGAVRERIAESQIALDQARTVCHQAAPVIHAQGNKAARHLVAEAKVAVRRAVLEVIDRLIQVHGGLGVAAGIPLAAIWGWHRAMRLFDGPDEVHLTTLARAELSREPLLAP